MNKVGKIVAVIHRSVFNEKKGKVEIVPARQLNQEIVAEYHDGRVRTISGDVWNVASSGIHKGADFVSLAVN